MISTVNQLQLNEKLGKSYKLCKEKEISALFKSGKKLYKFPFSASYMIVDENRSTPFQFVISVPKRNFKKATDRNRIKRVVKETFRKNKLHLEAFLIKENIQMSFFLLYNHKEKLTFEELLKKTEQFISFFIENLKNESKQ